MKENSNDITPRFSFVLPAYKARYLRGAMESILAQTRGDFELVVVNDASPEDLKSIVDTFDDSRIRYYENEKNIGGKDLIAQWNHCVEFATGEFLILASDDDTYHPQYLEKMAELIEQYPDCNIYRCRRRIVYTVSGKIDEEPPIETYLSKQDFICKKLNRETATGLQQHIFRRKRLMEIGGFKYFPYAWFADDAITILMADKGIAIHPEIMFDAYFSDLSISGKLNDRRTLTGKLDAVAQYNNFIMQQMSEFEPSEAMENAMNKYNIFRPLYCYKLMIESKLSAIIGATPYILFKLDLPFGLRIKYYLRSIAKRMLYH